MPSFLSGVQADHSSNVTISSDGLSAEWSGAGIGAVRSSRSIGQHQTSVFYFEATAHGHFDRFQIGVSADTRSLANFEAGSFEVAVETQGDGPFVARDEAPGSNETYGFVVDYRGDHPVVYVIGQSGALQDTRTLSDVSSPLFIQLSGVRRKQGNQVTINTGNDTTNWPFAHGSNLSSVLPSNVASALVLGWGSTHARQLDSAPTVSLTSSNNPSITLGSNVTLTATSQDAEDGAPLIRWEVPALSASPVSGTGNTFTTTPNAPGTHLIRYSVTDSLGKTDSHTVNVNVTGSVPPASGAVRLVLDGFSGDGIELSSDGLSAKWHVNAKHGVRANQGLASGEGFFYFEGRRLGGLDRNQGVGLVIGGVSLDPYSFDDTPPSCSVNSEATSIWQDLMMVRELGLGRSIEYYGFAVDYTGATPTVYVIMDGHVEATLRLSDATVPIYPMLYGNTTGDAVAYDMAINFGGSSFHADPLAALDEAQVDRSNFQQCWRSACP